MCLRVRTNAPYGLAVAAKADLEQARKDGVPAVVFADNVAKGVIDVLLEKPGAGDKR